MTDLNADSAAGDGAGLRRARADAGEGGGLSASSGAGRKGGEGEAGGQYGEVRPTVEPDGSRRERRQASSEAGLRPARADAGEGAESEYDSIAGLYDDWHVSVTEDVDFYVGEAVADGGPVVELGVGTGRIAVPTAQAGVHVIGVDSSAAMLEECRRRAAEASVSDMIDLRLGDLRDPPVPERVSLVTCPFRALLHLDSDADRLRALNAAYSLLTSGGRFIFDIFAPSREDIEETDARWCEREPGIWERADWNVDERRFLLTVRRDAAETTMHLSWIPTERWHDLLAAVGFQVIGCFGWFDRRPYAGEEDSVWIGLKPVVPANP